jgi:PhnB protein
MTKVNVYLSFNGDCEQAFDLYKSVFGGEFNYVGRFKDMPESGMPVPAESGEKIMHIGLPVSKETCLMGCDAIPGFGPDYQPGNNFSVCVNPCSEDETRRIFAGLSEGGTVVMPLDKTFWNSLFGMAIDRFGIAWSIDYALDSSCCDAEKPAAACGCTEEPAAAAGCCEEKKEPSCSAEKPAAGCCEEKKETSCDGKAEKKTSCCSGQ